MAKSVIITLYQVVVEHEVENLLYRCLSYYFTSCKDAKAFYCNIKESSKESSSNILSIKFICLVHYFDNYGRLLCAHGSSKKDAFEKLIEMLS